MINDATKNSFQELVEESSQLVQKQDGWQDSVKSGTGQVLIELMASMVERVVYMLERRSQENYLPTARLKTSIYAQSNGLGYLPRRRVSSSGLLELTLFDAKGNLTQTNGDLVIDRYTPITFEDRNFVVADQYRFPPSQKYPTRIRVVEGTKKEITIDPSDANSDLARSGYVLLSDFENIEEYSLTVHDSVGDYSDVALPIGDEAAIESIAFAAADQRVYGVRVAHDGLRVYFGDGINGVKPTLPITIRWIVSSGSAVNVLATGRAFKFASDKLTDDVNIVPRNTYQYRLVNAESITGGAEAETTEQIRLRAPDYVRTAGNAVTKHDYQFWLLRSGIGNVVDARCYGEQELGIDVYNMNNVYVTYLCADGSVLSPSNRRAAVKYLEQYATITTKPILKPAEIFAIAYDLKATRHPALPIANSALYDIVKRYFEDSFALGKNSLGTPIIHSEIVRDLMDLKTTVNGRVHSLLERADLILKRLALVRPLFNSSSHSLSFYDNDAAFYPYRMVVDDIPLVVTEGATPKTAEDIAVELKSKIELESDEYVITVTGSQMTISRVDGGDVQVSFLGTGKNSNGFSGIRNATATAKLPFNALKVEQTGNVFAPGTIMIKNPTTGEVVATDDGSGVVGTTGTIDYVTGVFTAAFDFPEGVYVEFEYEGEVLGLDIEIPLSAASTIAPVKAQYSSEVEMLSRITIL